MKTKELINKIKYSHYNSVVSANSKETQILSVFVNGLIVAQFSHLGSWLNFENDCPKEIAQWLVEYVKTPLEEREEKKYTLKMPTTILGGNELSDLYIQYKEKYFLSNDLSLLGIDNIKMIFTQSEIDKMPFPANFFIKEEV